VVVKKSFALLAYGAGEGDLCWAGQLDAWLVEILKEKAGSSGGFEGNLICSPSAA
jgi:hypothetical protein